MTKHQKLENPSGIERIVIDYLSQTHGLAYASLSPDLRIRWTTSNFHAFLLEPPADLQSQLLPDLLWEFVGAEPALDRVLRGKEPNFRLERVNRSLSDGSVGYFRFLVMPLDHDQPSKGLLLIVEDTTQEGRLEQQIVQDRNELRLTQAALAKANAELKRLNHMKSLFLSIAAHDMRAPLSAIAGYANIIQTDFAKSLAEPYAGYLAEVRTQVDQLNRLVEDFLQLDRLERGHLEIKPTPCDLNEIIRKLVQVLHETALQRNQVFEIRLEDNSNPVMADPGRLEQILYNLLSNAVKYTPPGGRMIIRSWREGESGVFQVQDSGTGMSENELTHVFELYYRTEPAQQSRTSGTGLGLYIVKTLIDAHQGQIDVSSQRGVGTTFTVYLPAYNMGNSATDLEPAS